MVDVLVDDDQVILLILCIGIRRFTVSRNSLFRSSSAIREDKVCCRSNEEGTNMQLCYVFSTSQYLTPCMSLLLSFT